MARRSISLPLAPSQNNLMIYGYMKKGWQQVVFWHNGRWLTNTKYILSGSWTKDRMSWFMTTGNRCIYFGDWIKQLAKFRCLVMLLVRCISWKDTSAKTFLKRLKNFIRYSLCVQGIGGCDNADKGWWKISWNTAIYRSIYFLQIKSPAYENFKIYMKFQSYINSV